MDVFGSTEANAVYETAITGRDNGTAECQTAVIASTELLIVVSSDCLLPREVQGHLHPAFVKAHRQQELGPFAGQDDRDTDAADRE